MDDAIASDATGQPRLPPLGSVGERLAGLLTTNFWKEDWERRLAELRERGLAGDVRQGEATAKA